MKIQTILPLLCETNLKSDHFHKKDNVEVFIKNADYAWENARTPEGQFYEEWSGNNRGRYYWLLHQATLVDIYARVSLFKNE